MEDNSFGRGTHTDHSNNQGDGHLTHLAMQSATPPAHHAADTAHPVAHNDADVVSRVAATGNVISGAGTTNPAAGADTNAFNSHITGISTGSAKTFSDVPEGGTTIQGEHGTLTINPDGSYTYQANSNACGTDIFTYRLANPAGEKSTAALTVSVLGDQATAGTCAVQRITPGPDGIVNLPPNVALSDIHVSGRDLVVMMPDGSMIVIVDGAVFVPQLVLGDVAIPPVNLAAVMVGDEIRPAAGGEGNELAPAAGAPPSSGGNFESPVGDIGDPAGLGDLIPPTELQFGQPTTEELGDFIEKKPSIEIITPDNPAGAIDATDHVDESGLNGAPQRPAPESPGSNAAANTETTTGTVDFDPGNEPATVTINGVAVTSVGQTFQGTFGVLKITSIGNNTFNYSYTLSDNTSGNNTADHFNMVVTDVDGDTAPGTLTINIIDDVPTARPDVDSVKEDGPIVADGNVMTATGGADANSTDGVADTQGADGATVTGVAVGSVGSASGNVGGTLHGTYGDLVLNANGNYVYTLNNAAANVQALKAGQTVTDVFTYTITDGDGDPSSTTLTITITGNNDAPVIGSATTAVSEEGLTGGIADSVGTPTDTTNSATASGTITVSDIDGDALTVTLGTPVTSLTSGGVAITWSGGGTGTLIGSANGTEIIRVTINNSGGYTVTLSGAIDHPNVNAEDVQSFTVPVNVNDGTTSSSGTLTVNIEDDSPAAPTVTTSGTEPVALTFDGGLANGNFTGAEGAGDTNASKTIASVSFASAFTFGNLTAFGGDGAGTSTVSYALQLHAGFVEGSVSGLTTGGVAIRLYENGGVITGSTSATEGGINAGNTAFTIAVNSGTGVVTLTQSMAVDHSQTDTYNNAYISDLAQLGNNLVDLKASAVVVDRDGDTSPTASALLDMGGNIKFGDDGPGNPTVATSGTEPITLTFDGGLANGNFVGPEGAGDTNASSTIATVSFASAFTFGNLNDFGADGAGATTISYALQLHAGFVEGSVSGLTSGGVAIRLYENGGVITGSTALTEGAISGANTAFTLSVNSSTGVVTLTQSMPLDHSQTDTYNHAYISDLAQLANNLVDLKASAVTTDSEGDHTVIASALLDMGGNVEFGDDGPGNPTVSRTEVEPIALTFDGGLANGNFTGSDLAGDTNASKTIASVSFASAFALGNLNDFGADGAGATTISYALQLHAGFVEGSVSGLTSGGVAIRLYENGGVITGSTALTEGAISGANTAFTISVNSGTGVVTLTQSMAIDHSQTDTYNNAYISDLAQLGNGLVDLKASAVTTDSEGDHTAAASALLDMGGNIRFGDDGPGNPTVALSGTDPIALTFDGGLANGNFTGTDLAGDTNASKTIAAVSFASAFSFGNLNDFGADGAGATTISYALQFHAGFVEGSVSGLTSGGLAIRLYENGGVITGSTALTEGAISGSNTVFTLSVNSSTGVVTLTQLDTIDHSQADIYSGSYINDLKSLPNDLVDLKASAVTTDSEGDHTVVASALLDMGGNVQFGDDGPSAPTTSTGTEPVALTFDGGLANGNFTGAEGAGDTNPSKTIASVSFAGAFSFGSSSFGADGPGSSSISYALQFAGGYTEGGVSGLTSGGVAIRLYESGGVITGSTALTEGAINGSNTVFTIAVDSGTGVLTLTQLDTIDHTQTDLYNNAYINDIKALPNGLVELKATGSVTDFDGDTSAAATATIDLGGNIQFGDDGPGNPTVVLSQTEPVVLTFDGGLANGNFTGTDLAGDSNASKTIATVGFASAFTFGNLNDYGADGAGATTISYALQLHAGFVEGSLSGLSTGGVAIRLYENGGVITGSTALTEGAISGANTAFTLSVNSSTGVVTLTQSMPLDHSQTDTYNNAYISDLAQLGNNLVDLKASAVTTDSEGDHTVVASALLDMGGNVQFGDDGPGNPTVTLSGTDPIALTFDGGLAGGNFTGTDLAGDTNASKTIATVSFASAFTFGNLNDFGADGPGASTKSYTLQLHAGFVEGSASGLTTAGGTAIRLYENGGVITGSTSATEGGISGANTVFTISVDSNGVVTLTQLQPVDQASHDLYTGSYINDLAILANNLVDLKASVVTTDSEGDHTVVASALLDLGGNIEFGDDGPSIDINLVGGVLLTIDETDGITANANETDPVGGNLGVATITAANLFTKTASPGADGAASTTYALSINGGNGTASGYLYSVTNESIVLVNNAGVIEGHVATTGGALAFTISVNGSGDLTMTQYLAIEHSDPTNPDETSSGMTANTVLLTATLTDKDGDTAHDSIDVGSIVRIQDDAPLLVAAQNMNIQNSGDVAHTAIFSYNLGSDGVLPTNDVFKTVTFSAVVNSTTVQATTPLTQVSEDADSAVFSFSFTYANTPTTTATENGTISFWKTSAGGHTPGTYTVDLQDPIAGFSTLSVQNGQPPVFYDYPLPPAGPTGDVDNGIAVVQLASNFFIQFTGQEDTQDLSGGTFDLNDHWGNGSQSEVKISSTAIGVFGNSVQDSDVLDYNFYATDPGAALGAPTATAGTAFIKISQFNGAEDFVVTLKLADPATPGTVIYRTFLVEAGDVLTTAPAGYAPLSNGEGYIIFEPNDYINATGVPDNYQIAGMQLRSSTEGVQSDAGEVFNFNGAVNAFDSSAAAFGAAGGGDHGSNDNDVFKIIDIGVITTSTTNQTATLTFNVTLQDSDLDTVSQTLTATVTSSVDSTSAIALDPSKTTAVPVVLDLNGDGLHFLAADAGVHYDFNGDGAKEATAWVRGDDGILVRDANGNGTVDGASEIVFGHDGMTDMQALAAQYGTTLNANDADFAKFGVWQDANSNGVVDAGEYHTLAQLGITSISLVSDGQGYTAANGEVLVTGESSYTTAGGTTRAVADVTFATATTSANDTDEQEQQNNTLNAVTTAALAAGLVATVPAAAAAADTAPTVQSEAVTAPAAPTASVADTPVAHDDSSTAGQLLNDGNSQPVDAPVTTTTSGEDSGANHAVDAPADSGPVAPNALLDASHIQLPDVAPTAAPSVDMAGALQVALPAGAAQAAATATGAQLGQVLADALSGGHGDVPSIDQLLGSLSGGSATSPDLQPLAHFVETAILDHVQIPQEIMTMLMQMATQGHDAAAAAAAAA
jgi:T1SS-143 domain-containing protein